jgi:hypothetical protein
MCQQGMSFHQSTLTTSMTKQLAERRCLRPMVSSTTFLSVAILALAEVSARPLLALTAM